MRVFVIIYFMIMAICFGVESDSRYLDYMYFVAEYSLPLYLLYKLKQSVPKVIYMALGTFLYSMLLYITIEYFIYWGQPRFLVFVYFCGILALTYMITKKLEQ